MLSSVNTLVLTGIEATLVKVEVDIQTGLPGFDTVGMKIGMDIKKSNLHSNTEIKVFL